MVSKVKKMMKNFIMLITINKLVWALLNLILLKRSVSVFYNLNGFQSVLIENKLIDNYQVMCFLLLVNVSFFFYFHGGLSQFLFVLKKIILWTNILMFGISNYLLYLHEIAFDSPLIMIPFIGLTILKTKWTEEQLQIFFEEFQEKLVSVFTKDEKMALIQTALNPSNLKENMIQKDLEKLAKDRAFADLLKTFLCFGVTLTVCLCLSYFIQEYVDIYSNVRVEHIKIIRYRRSLRSYNDIY